MIDPEQAFVRVLPGRSRSDLRSQVKPIGLLKTMLSGRKEERQALAEILEVMQSIYKGRKEKQIEDKSDLFSSIVESLPSVLPDKSEEEIMRVAAYLMIGLHMASQTNLSSAATWLTINMLTYTKERCVSRL